MWGPRARDATRRATRALARALGERAVEARAPTGGSTVPGRARALSIASSASARVGEAGVMPASMRVERRWWKKANRRVEGILRAPVSGLGDVDEVARVRPGRARNHLVPGKLATYVNAEKLAAARERLAARERARIEAGGEDGDEAAATAQEEEHKRKERATVMKMLTAEPAIAFRRIKDKKTGKPRIAVTRENIVEEIRRQKSLNLAPGALMLERPIVDFGEYDIPLFIRGEPAGERTVPVVVRERL